MAGGDGPGIAGLHRLIEEHGEALEADLLRQGLDLRDLGGALSYRRLRVVVENLPADSALVRVQLGDAAMWTPTDHLLADVIDLLLVANWQRAGNAHAPRPKPIRRPGVKDRNTIGGGTSMPLEDLKKWAAARREGGVEHAGRQ